VSWAFTKGLAEPPSPYIYSGKRSGRSVRFLQSGKRLPPTLRGGRFAERSLRSEQLDPAAYMRFPSASKDFQGITDCRTGAQRLRTRAGAL
jgi:hypothetical protein